MTRAPDDRFNDWKEKGEAIGLLAAAQMFGAKLKKHGTEFVGPCPYCLGTDRFAINLQKGKWHCRGHGGGSSVIALAMHVGNIAFKEAIEQLTGESCPTGQSAPLSEEEKAERNRRRIANEDAQRRRQEQEEQRQDDTREAAQLIWDASGPLSDTIAEKYLAGRGIPVPDKGWPDVLRFHPSLPYPGKGKYPVLVCRVDDVDGELTAVWRIYLRADGRKADVADAKLGLGPAGGGAVRLFGTGQTKTIAIAEGVETALGYWMLTCGRQPVWAALSTAGLIGFEVPLGIERLTIVPDGDRPIKKRGTEYEPAVPAGRKAANALFVRLVEHGIRCNVAAEPPMGKDWLDLWNAHAREVA